MGWIAPIAPFSIDHDQVAGHVRAVGNYEVARASRRGLQALGFDLRHQARPGGQGPRSFSAHGCCRGGASLSLQVLPGAHLPWMRAGRVVDFLVPLTVAIRCSNSSLMSLQVYSDGDGLGAEDARVPSGS